MGYDLRERKQKFKLASYSIDEENDSDYTLSDPDNVMITDNRPRRSKINVGGAEKSMQSLKIHQNVISFLGQDWKLSRRGRPSNKRNGNVTFEDVLTSSMDLEKERKKRKLDTFCSVQESVMSFRTIMKLAETKTVLSWLIGKGIVKEDETVVYVFEDMVKVGRATMEGVFCECCNKVMTVWEFEVHAGSNVIKRPYENIFVVRTRKCLLLHMEETWNKQKEIELRKFNHVVPKIDAPDSSDDTCQICADGGDLICCEKCPSTFHPSCIGMENIPRGDWLCPYCVCKYCGGSSEEMLTCYQCEKKYHWKCFLDIEGFDINKTGLTLFCGTTCREVNEKLQRLIGVKHELKDGFSWTLIRRMDPFETDDEQTRLECNVKISLAWRLLNDCFRIINDRYTRINILQSVVYNRGSNLSRMNFRGFYTAILEKNDRIVAAATIRMHGNKLADMPFIATQQSCRSKGLGRMLFDAIEHVFSSIEVKHLVIPSIQEVANMWQGKFGFFPIDDGMKTKLANFNTLMFPCTSRLQKTFLDNSDSSEAMDVDENNDTYLKVPV